MIATHENGVIGHPRLSSLDDHGGRKAEGPGVYVIECPACGYESDEQVIIRPARCPKCHRFTWHRRPRPGMLGKLAGSNATPA